MMMELFLGLLILTISFYSYSKIMFVEKNFKPIFLAPTWLLLISIREISNALLELQNAYKILFYVTLTVLIMLILCQIVADIKTKMNKKETK